MITKRVLCLCVASATCISCVNNFKKAVPKRCKGKNWGDDLIAAVQAGRVEEVDKFFYNEMRKNVCLFSTQLKIALKLASLQGNLVIAKKIRERIGDFGIFYLEDPIWDSEFVYYLCSNGLWKIFTHLFDEGQWNMLSIGMLNGDNFYLLLNKSLVLYRINFPDSILSTEDIKIATYGVYDKLLCFTQWFSKIIAGWTCAQLWRCLDKAIDGNMLHVNKIIMLELFSRWEKDNNLYTTFSNERKMLDIQNPMLHNYLVDRGLYPTFR